MKLDSTSLVWAVVLGGLAALGLWDATGHRIDWAWLTIAAPIVLIATGVLGLLLSRAQHLKTHHMKAGPARAGTGRNDHDQPARRTHPRS